MTTVTFSQLRNHAKEYFDAVERGETIEVVRRGKPIALVSPVRKRDPDYWKRPVEPLKLEGVSLSKLILEEREEGL